MISGGSAAFPATFATIAAVSRRSSRGQRQHRHMRLPGPRRLKLGAEHRQQQHRPVRDPLYHAVQQFARTRVDPVKVIEHHQHRLLPRKTFNLPQQRLERLVLLALRRDIERRCEIG